MLLLYGKMLIVYTLSLFIYLFIHLFLYLFQDLLNDQIKQKRTEIDWSTMEINGMDDIKVNNQSKGTSPDQTM